jgi:Beta-lactamase superfamily domain
MKVTFIGHAALLIETQGIRILSDPWWEGPCFGTQWWNYPRADVSALGVDPVDYVYVSHGHHDHLHLGTLRRLPKGFRLLVSSTLNLGPFLTARGFDVIEVTPNIEIALASGVTAHLMPTCNDDTLLCVSDGTYSCLNLNDALHSAPAAVRSQVLERLKRLYPTPTSVFCGYGIASHFPASYVVPGIDRAATVARRQAFFNRQWCQIVDALAPKIAVPFAADVVYLDQDLFWANEPIHNSERPTDVFKAMYASSRTTVYDPAPGFSLEKDRCSAPHLFEPIDTQKLKSDMAAECEIANRPHKIPTDGMEHLAELIRRNVALCQLYLAEFKPNYRTLIQCHEGSDGILLIKSGRQISVDRIAAGTDPRVDLVFRSRFSYLRRALAEEYGGEVLYVGSGCTIEYRSPEMVRHNLHQELLAVLRHRTTPPASRFGDQPEWLYHAKRGVKSLFGRLPQDPYDLTTWLVVNAGRSP